MKNSHENKSALAAFFNLEINLPHTSLVGLSNVSIDGTAETQLDPSKPTLLFLHGYLDNAFSFASMLPHFSNYQCIAIDLAGHGHSQHRSPDAHYHLTDFAYDLHALIEVLSLQQVVLIGHSLGAIVCSIYASTQASVIKGFVCIESCGPLAESTSSTATQLKASFESRINANSPIKQPKNMQALVKARCASGELDPETAHLILSRNITYAKDLILWRTDKRLRTKSPFRMSEPQAMAILSNIACPWSVILGDNGFTKVKEAILRRKDAFEGADIETFPGKHYVHIDSTSLVVEAVKKHLTLWLH